MTLGLRCGWCTSLARRLFSHRGLATAPAPRGPCHVRGCTPGCCGGLSVHPCFCCRLPPNPGPQDGVLFLIRDAVSVTAVSDSQHQPDQKSKQRFLFSSQRNSCQTNTNTRFGQGKCPTWIDLDELIWTNHSARGLQKRVNDAAGDEARHLGVFLQGGEDLRRECFLHLPQLQSVRHTQDARDPGERRCALTVCLQPRACSDTDAAGHLPTGTSREGRRQAVSPCEPQTLVVQPRTLGHRVPPRTGPRRLHSQLLTWSPTA